VKRLWAWILAIIWRPEATPLYLWSSDYHETVVKAEVQARLDQLESELAYRARLGKLCDDVDWLRKRFEEEDRIKLARKPNQRTVPVYDTLEQAQLAAFAELGEES